jgi:hypothetical protein
MKEMTSIDHSKFVNQLIKLHEHLPAKSYCLPGMFNEVYPVPQLLYSSEYSLLTQLGECISLSVRKLVENYLSSSVMKEYLPLSEKTIELFEMIKHIPISNTLIRPDFIESKSEKPMICEIGTRFPLNGYLSSVYLQTTVRDVPPKYDLELSSIFDPLDLTPADDEVIVLIGEEVGYDIHYLSMEFKKSRFIHYMSEDWLDISSSSTIILELNKDEVELILDNLVKLLLKGTRVINDPRIVILGHDKMLLKFLADPKHMSPLVGDTFAKLLNTHVIKTYSPIHDGINLKEKEKWIAKLKHGGKRKGMMVGSLVTIEQWENLDTQYVIQPFIPQDLHPIYNHITRDFTLAYRVGIILTTGEQCAGLGMYRFYSQDFEFVGFSSYNIMEGQK